MITRESILDNKRGTAKDKLRHYFKTLFNACGKKWTEDNDYEIGEIIDCIIRDAQENNIED